MKITVVSGGFDPLHSGHLAYFKSARDLGDKLIVALNSDEWLDKKKGKYFMPFDERKSVIESLRMVDEVIDFDDDEIGSCINALIKIKKKYPNDEITFCNGGDRGKEDCPEMQVSDIKFSFGVGGDDKKNSSSWILKEWQYSKEERVWGEFYDLFKDENVKVKELIISPGKGMSFQRHFERSEIWFVSKGKCIVNYSEDDPENLEEIYMNVKDIQLINKKAWHQIINPHAEPCHIIEIQYGEKTQEDDIERLRYYEE
jgi:cytidyltransferase-like protein